MLVFSLFQQSQSFPSLGRELGLESSRSSEVNQEERGFHPWVGSWVWKAYNPHGGKIVLKRFHPWVGSWVWKACKL